MQHLRGSEQSAAAAAAFYAAGASTNPAEGLVPSLFNNEIYEVIPICNICVALNNQQQQRQLFIPGTSPSSQQTQQQRDLSRRYLTTKYMKSFIPNMQHLRGSEQSAAAAAGFYAIGASDTGRHPGQVPGKQRGVAGGRASEHISISIHK